MADEKKATTKPKRWKHRDPAAFSAEGGTYARAIFGNEAFCQKLANVIASWPHVEDQMIEVMSYLMGVPWEQSRTVPARQIFKSITTHAYQVKLLRNLLKSPPVNMNKPEQFDEAITTFAEIAGQRNDYVHSLWWTRLDDNSVWIQRQSLEDGSFFTAVRFNESEFDDFFAKQKLLIEQIRAIRMSEVEPAVKRLQAQSVAEPPASPEKSQ